MTMLLPAIGSVISNVLIDKGLNLLGSATRNITDAGIEALGDLVKTKTGIDITDKDDLHNLTTEQVLKLKEFEIQELESINRSMVEFNKDIIRDRESARAMQIAIIQSSDSWLAKNFIYIFSLILTIGMLGYVYYAAFWMKLDNNNMRVVDTSIGFIFNSFAVVLAFFYGGENSKLRNMFTRKNDNK